jgi:hypothetical protein
MELLRRDGGVMARTGWVKPGHEIDTLATSLQPHIAAEVVAVLRLSA